MPQRLSLPKAIDLIPNGKQAWVLTKGGRMHSLRDIPKKGVDDVMALTWEGAQDWCMIEPSPSHH